MAYATTDQLAIAAGGNERLVQLADWDRDATADPAVLAMYLTQAESEIDSYLGKQWAVALGTVPPAIAGIAARIAIYRLRCARQMAAQDDHDAYKVDESALKAYRDGDNALTPQQPASASMRVDGTFPRAESKDVSRGKLRGFS